MFHVAIKFILSVFVFVVATNNVAFAKMGFWSVADTRIPAPVKHAQNSVFKVIVPGGGKAKIDIGHIKDLISLQAWIKKGDGLSDDEKILWFAQLKKCWNDHAQICTIFEGVEEASAFLISDHQTLMTVSHVFIDYFDLNPPVKGDGVDHREVPMILRNNKGEIVFGASGDDAVDTVSVASLVMDPQYNGNLTLDFGMIKISKSLQAEPLELAPDYSFCVGDTVYSLGYPMETNDRAKVLHVPDSKGVGLYVTYGPTASFSKSAEVLGDDTSEFSTTLIQNYIDGFIYVNSDSVPGMSGGVTLNKAGQILGITRGHFPADFHATQKAYSETIRMSWVKRYFEI
jgi:hypothetical protein